MTSPTIAVRDAICATLGQLALIPTFTLPDGAGEGDAAVAVDSAGEAALSPPCVLDWLDYSGEVPYIVGTLTGATAALTFAGRPWSGLQYGHASGALCCTNLLRSAPNESDLGIAAEMMSATTPVWRVFVPTNARKWIDARTLGQNPCAVVVHQMPMTQPQGAQLQSDLYRQMVADRAAADIATLIQRLGQNFTLTVNGVGYAVLMEEFDEVAQATEYPSGTLTVPVWEHYLIAQIQASDIHY